MNKKEYHIPNTLVIAINDEGILAAFTGAQAGTSPSSGGFQPTEDIPINEDEKNKPTTAIGWSGTWAD